MYTCEIIYILSKLLKSKAHRDTIHINNVSVLSYEWYGVVNNNVNNGLWL